MSWLPKLRIAIWQKFKHQVDFARATGFTEQKISKIVCGRQEPTAAEKQIICEKLGVRENEIFD